MAENEMQLQHASKDSASFTHDGVSVESDSDGFITVASQLVEHAKAHGFVVPEKKESVKGKPLAKLAKGGDKQAAPDDTESDGSDKVTDSETVKPAQKGAKLAKGGAE